jgi:hypothetical protein
MDELPVIADFGEQPGIDGVGQTAETSNDRVIG